jgi:hypothetical protein
MLITGVSVAGVKVPEQCESSSSSSSSSSEQTPMVSLDATAISIGDDENASIDVRQGAAVNNAATLTRTTANNNNNNNDSNNDNDDNLSTLLFDEQSKRLSDNDIQSSCKHTEQQKPENNILKRTFLDDEDDLDADTIARTMR